MKTLILRRGILLAASTVGLLIFLLMFTIHDPNDSSDILSDSSRRLLKGQNIEMDRPADSISGDEKIQDSERLRGLESQIDALHGNMENINSLNRDDTQGKCFLIKNSESLVSLDDQP